jgi:hypothetical protein
MWDDDSCDDENDGGFSFAEMGKLEAAKTSEALLKIDELLPIKIEDKKADTKENIAEISDKGSAFDYRRYQSNGYDAHSDGVDDKEIQSWQKAFPYLLVKGVSITPKEIIPKESSGSDEFGEFFAIPTPIDQTGEIRPNVSNLSFTNNSNQSAISELIIVGKKLTIPKVVIESEDEINGILDEIIEVNVTPDRHDLGNDDETSDSDILSPAALIRDEIISGLLDDVWPEVVEALKPLIRKVVRISRVTDLKYDLKQKKTDRII